MVHTYNCCFLCFVLCQTLFITRQWRLRLSGLQRGLHREAAGLAGLACLRTGWWQTDPEARGLGSEVTLQAGPHLDLRVSQCLPPSLPHPLA